MDGIERENGKVLSFQAGVERLERSKSEQSNLKARINEIVNYHGTLAEQMMLITDTDRHEAMRERLKKLSEMALRGAELLGKQETEKIQAFLAEDYKALK